MPATRKLSKETRSWNESFSTSPKIAFLALLTATDDPKNYCAELTLENWCFLRLDAAAKVLLEKLFVRERFDIKIRIHATD